MSEHANAAALTVRRLRKVYGGTVALADVDLEVRAGEIHGLLGENGAGKSTLVRLLAGVEHADSGSFSLFGEEMPARVSPESVTARGMAFIHQNLGLVEDLSVAENVALSAGFAFSGPFISWRRTRRRAEAALARMGVSIAADARVGDLPMAMRSVTAIARALARDLRVLVLDEPTATLPAHEVDTLFEILRRLRNEGVAIILITHRLEEVLAVTDRVTVLRDGRVAGTRESAACTNADLVRLIVGSDLPDRTAHDAEPGEAAVVFDRVVAGTVGPLTFQARRGEVLGITGLSGAGHTMVPQVLFGLEPVRQGTMTVGGRVYAPSGPAAATRAGCAFVPADRNGEGAVTSLDLRENLFMNPAGRSWRPLRRRAETDAAARVLTAFDVRPPAPTAEFSTLSGGNAQKVVLARCLSGAPQVVVLEEPTAAVDIGARNEIHSRLRAMARSRRAVIVVSSDLEEIERVCDRAVVMERGRIRGVLEGRSVTAPALLEAAYGMVGDG